MPVSYYHRLSWASALVLLGGCALSDAPPDPEVQPLEIIAGSSVRPERPCLLNVSRVRAGTHKVVIGSESGPATVRLVDASGRAVLQRRVDSHPAEGGGFEVNESDQGSVRLDTGDYRVECRLRGKGAYTVRLRVDPARPGFGEQRP
jgi:hypothetical protein